MFHRSAHTTTNINIFAARSRLAPTSHTDLTPCGPWALKTDSRHFFSGRQGPPSTLIRERLGPIFGRGLAWCKWSRWSRFAAYGRQSTTYIRQDAGEGCASVTSSVKSNNLLSNSAEKASNCPASSLSWGRTEANLPLHPVDCLLQTVDRTLQIGSTCSTCTTQDSVQIVGRVSRHSSIHPRLLFTREDNRGPLLTQVGIPLDFARWPVFPGSTARCTLLPLPTLRPKPIGHIRAFCSVFFS